MMVSSFLQCLKDKHGGSLVKAWKQSLDTDKSGLVSKEEFIAAMEKLEWEGDAARLFKLYDIDGGGSISLEEIDEKAHQAMVRGDDLLGLDVEEDKAAKRGKGFSE